MTTVYVGISNNQVVSEWSAPQGANAEPIYQEIDDSDQRYVDWQTYLSAKASYMAAQNVVITSTATAALDGTYAADANTRSAIANQRQSIALDSTFLDGTTTLDWPDIAGITHSFGMTDFTNFGKAVSIYAAQLEQAYLAIKANHSVGWNPPSNAITIP
jgi:hypothetical protein